MQNKNKSQHVLSNTKMAKEKTLCLSNFSLKVVTQNIQLFNMKCTGCRKAGPSLRSMMLSLKQKESYLHNCYVTADKTGSLL